MQRAFGIENSGNQRRNAELSSEVRVGILEAVEAGEKKTGIAHRSHCDGRTIYKTIALE
jgi:hypothetical protein